MRLLLTILLCVVCLSASALTGLYYVKVDADGYIIDITSETGDTSFTRINFTVDIPADVHCKCYKFIDGQFVRDEEKYALWLASRQPQPVSTPDAIGGGE